MYVTAIFTFLSNVLDSVKEKLKYFCNFAKVAKSFGPLKKDYF